MPTLDAVPSFMERYSVETLKLLPPVETQARSAQQAVMALSTAPSTIPIDLPFVDLVPTLDQLEALDRTPALFARALLELNRGATGKVPANDLRLSTDDAEFLSVVQETARRGHHPWVDIYAVAVREMVRRDGAPLRNSFGPSGRLAEVGALAADYPALTAMMARVRDRSSRLSGYATHLVVDELGVVGVDQVTEGILALYGQRNRDIWSGRPHDIREELAKPFAATFAEAVKGPGHEEFIKQVAQPALGAPVRMSSLQIAVLVANADQPPEFLVPAAERLIETWGYAARTYNVDDARNLVNSHEPATDYDVNDARDLVGHNDPATVAVRALERNRTAAFQFATKSDENLDLLLRGGLTRAPEDYFQSSANVLEIAKMQQRLTDFLVVGQPHDLVQRVIDLVGRSEDGFLPPGIPDAMKPHVTELVRKDIVNVGDLAVEGGSAKHAFRKFVEAVGDNDEARKKLAEAAVTYVRHELDEELAILMRQPGTPEINIYVTNATDRAGKLFGLIDAGLDDAQGEEARKSFLGVVKSVTSVVAAASKRGAAVPVTIGAEVADYFANAIPDGGASPGDVNDLEREVFEKNLPEVLVGEMYNSPARERLRPHSPTFEEFAVDGGQPRKLAKNVENNLLQWLDNEKWAPR